MNDKNLTYKILLALEDPSRHKLFSELLSEQNYKIERVASYDELQQKINWLHFDLLLIDNTLAQENDYKVCKNLQTESNLQYFPIVFIFPSFEKKQIEKAIGFGVEDYLCEPFSDDELLLRIQLILDKKRKREVLLQENKGLEQQIHKHSRKLQKVNEQLTTLDHAKNDFLRLISHELKTPLNGLVGVMEVLKAAGVEEEWQDYLAIIKPSVSRLTRFSEYAILITSLLAGKDFKKRLIKVNTLIDECICRVQEQADQKGIEIVRYHTNEDVKVFVHKDFVVTSIYAILENAIKHSPLDKKIVVKITFDYGKVAIHISDQGGGFSEEARQRLFQFFSSSNILEHSEGLGLGLAAAKLVMESHKGNINIQTSSQGATVKLSFRKF